MPIYSSPYYSDVLYETEDGYYYEVQGYINSFPGGQTEKAAGSVKMVSEKEAHRFKNRDEVREVDDITGEIWDVIIEALRRELSEEEAPDIF